MNRKNGFTLVELMVVIVIIGVLAAVAIPKMMAAVNKARASEGPQILGSISNLQTAYAGETGSTLELPEGGNAPAPVVSGDNWSALGFELIPGSRWYRYQSTGTAADPTAAITPSGREFEATATTQADLGKDAPAPIELTIDQDEVRLIDGAPGTPGQGMAALIPNWR